MKHFLIYTNAYKDKNLEVTNRICKFLQEREIQSTVIIPEQDWKKEPEQKTVVESSVASEADMMLVLGGDGTVLEAARTLKKYTIPIVGVNLGKLGYLTEIELSNLEESLEQLVQGDYSIEQRMTLSGTVSRNEEVIRKDWALNDIVVARQGKMQILRFEIYVNGQFLHRYQADGMIVTSPTGSTGYNLSAGGPLVSPSANLLILTPICPHSMNQRSIILSAEDEVEIRIPGQTESYEQQADINFDGRTFALMPGDRVKIRRSSRQTSFVHLGKVNFLDVLNRKMREN